MVITNSLFRVSCLAVVLAAEAGASLAEDVKGKWYIGGNLGVLVTTDNVRSNAALLIAPLGADGAPFTGDRGEEVSCDTSNVNVFCDPRPDDLLSRQTQLEQTLKLDGTIGYGLTSNVSVQLDTGYYKGDVLNFDVFTHKVKPANADFIHDPCIQLGQALPCDLKTFRLRDIKQPITAATVTEIPVAVNAIVRFRKDSNFNPYLGAGAGYIFTSLKQDSSVDSLNGRLRSLHIISTTDEFGINYGRLLGAIDTEGTAPFTHPVSVTLDDGFLWQAVGGGEYFFNDRLSFVFDARYVIADQTINISMKGEDQINIDAYTEDLFRPDGSLRVFKTNQEPPNPKVVPFVPGGPQRYTCKPGLAGNQPPPDDYDNDGIDDACYQGTMNPLETVVVQGGDIRLTNFSFGFGMRFHF